MYEFSFAKYGGHFPKFQGFFQRKSVRTKNLDPRKLILFHNIFRRISSWKVYISVKPTVFYSPKYFYIPTKCFYYAIFLSKSRVSNNWYLDPCLFFRFRCICTRLHTVTILEFNVLPKLRRTVINRVVRILLQ